MDIRRTMLVAACGMLSYALWTAWQKDYPVNAPTETPAVISTHTPASILPTLKNDDSTRITDNQSQAGFPEIQGEQQENSRLVSIKTDVLDLKIDLNQGDVIGAQLLNYPESVEQKEKPFTLLNNRVSTRYVANSNILVIDQQALKHMVTEFSSENNNYTLEANKNQLIVSLIGKTNDGISVKKEFIFTCS